MKTPRKLGCSIERGWRKNFFWLELADMEQERKKCMVCGKVATLKGGICDPCQDRIRKEALGKQANVRGEAEKELKKHGVTPDPGTKKK